MARLLLLVALLLAPAAGADAPPLTRFDVAIVGGTVQGDRTLEVDRGAQVEIHITSDQEMELHLHGYDVIAEVGPERAGEIAFVAHASGRFAVESHGGRHHQVVFYVRVGAR